MSPDERGSYYAGLHTESLAAAHDLARHHDFSRYRHLADVGGGSGGLAIGLARAWPNLSATIVDLPGTTAVAQHYVHEAGLGDRVRVMAADIVNEALPGSYDVAILRGVLIVLTLGAPTPSWRTKPTF